MFTVFLDDDQTFCGLLREELGSLGLVAQSLQAGQDWGSEIRSDSQILLICIRGLGNRLAALRRLAGTSANQGAVLLAKNLGSSFASLCFELGAHAVLNRHDSPEQLAPMIALLASAAGSKHTLLT